MALRFVALLLTLTASLVAQAKAYNFKELSVKDYTEMEALVRKEIGTNTIDDVEREPKIREGLRLVLSRRNTDGKRTSLMTNLQGQLPETYFMLSIQKITEKAIADLKDTKKPEIERATAYVILENMMSEFASRGRDYISNFELIAKADIEIDESLGTYRRLAGMSNNVSPSETAEAYIKQIKSKLKTASASDSPDLED